MPALLATLLISTALLRPDLVPPPAPADLNSFTLSQTWSCTSRKTCPAIATCDEARWYLANCSWGSKLDRDRDGIPCETLCGSSR